MRFSAAGASHVGRVRENNEDSGFAGHSCLLVADGVGGAAAGEVASATAAYVVAASVLVGADEEPSSLLRSAVALAQEQLRLGVARDPARAGMATTLTAAVTDGERFALVHLGDSRGYLVRDGRLSRLTVDQTFVQRLREEGRLAESDVATHPWRNVVLRSLDGDVTETGELLELELAPGDRVLLASDGLTDLVAEDEIARTVRELGDAEAVDALVRAALDAGGHDNVTCVMGTVSEGDPVDGHGTLFGAARDPRIVVDPAAVRYSRPA